MQSNHMSCDRYDGSYEGYTSVPTDIPSGMKYIYLDDNDISHINDESFDETSTDFSTVEELHLDYNLIESVSERAFEGFQSLTEIHLHSTEIEYIVFKEDDIPQLEYLNLELNQLAQIPTFHGFFQSLTTLYLTENSISHIGAEDFENITNIDSLYLGDNYLVIFELEQELSNLHYLNFRYNELTDIPALNGTYNSINEINIQDNYITVEPLLTLKERIQGLEQSLTKLWLGRNEDLANHMSVVVNFLQQFSELMTVNFTNKIFL